MNILLVEIRDWAYRNFKRRPVLSVLALALVTAISALSYALWSQDVTTWDGTNPWSIIDVPGE